MTFLQLSLLYLFTSGLFLDRPAVQPNCTKRNPPNDRDCNPCNPRMRRRNDIAARPLVVRKVSHSDSSLLKHIRHERSLVIDQEIKNAVLIR